MARTQVIGDIHIKRSNNFYLVNIHDPLLTHINQTELASSYRTQESPCKPMIAASKEALEYLCSNDLGTRYAGNPRYLINEASVYADIIKGNYRNAAKTLRKTLGKMPEIDHEITASIALCYAKLDDFESAEEVLSRLIGLQIYFDVKDIFDDIKRYHQFFSKVVTIDINS